MSNNYNDYIISLSPYFHSKLNDNTSTIIDEVNSNNGTISGDYTLESEEYDGGTLINNVSEWDFNYGSGNTLPDKFRGRDAQINNYQWNTDSDGDHLYLTGNDSHINFGDNTLAENKYSFYIRFKVHSFFDSARLIGRDLSDDMCFIFTSNGLKVEWDEGGDITVINNLQEDTIYEIVYYAENNNKHGVYLDGNFVGENNIGDRHNNRPLVIGANTEATPQPYANPEISVYNFIYIDNNLISSNEINLLFNNKTVKTSGQKSILFNNAKINYGNIFNDYLSKLNNEFVLSLLLKPLKLYNFKSNNSNYNVFLSKDDFELGISPSQELLISLRHSDNVSDIKKILTNLYFKLNGWNYLEISKRKIYNIDTWYNLEDNTQNATKQGNPELLQSELNNKAVMKLGYPDYYSLPNDLVRNISEFSIYAVVKLGDLRVFYSKLNSQKWPRLSLDVSSTGFGCVVRDSNESDWDNFSYDATDESGNYAIIACEWNYLNKKVKLYLNGIIEENNFNNVSSDSTADSNSIEVGIGYDYQNNSGSLLAELLVFKDHIPSESNRQQLEGYLAYKWGLEGKLESSHPHKNTDPGGLPIFGSGPGLHFDASDLDNSFTLENDKSVIHAKINDQPSTKITLYDTKFKDSDNDNLLLGKDADGKTYYHGLMSQFYLIDGIKKIDYFLYQYSLYFEGNVSGKFATDRFNTIDYKYGGYNDLEGEFQIDGLGKRENVYLLEPENNKIIGRVSANSDGNFKFEKINNKCYRILAHDRENNKLSHCTDLIKVKDNNNLVVNLTQSKTYNDSEELNFVRNNENQIFKTFFTGVISGVTKINNSLSQVEINVFIKEYNQCVSKHVSDTMGQFYIDNLNPKYHYFIIFVDDQEVYSPKVIGPDKLNIENILVNLDVMSNSNNNCIDNSLVRNVSNVYKYSGQVKIFDENANLVGVSSKIFVYNFNNHDLIAETKTNNDGTYTVYFNYSIEVYIIEIPDNKNIKPMINYPKLSPIY